MCVYKMSVSKLNSQIIYQNKSRLQKTTILMILHEPGRRSDSMTPAVLAVQFEWKPENCWTYMKHVYRTRITECPYNRFTITLDFTYSICIGWCLRSTIIFVKLWPKCASGLKCVMCIKHQFLSKTGRYWELASNVWSDS